MCAQLAYLFSTLNMSSYNILFLHGLWESIADKCIKSIMKVQKAVC